MNYNKKDFVIGEKKRVFQSVKWTVFQAAANLPKIGKVFALPVSFLFSAGGSTEDQVSSNLSEAIPKALYMLFEQLEEQNPIPLFEMILQSVYTENGTRKVDVEKDFEDIGELVELVGLVLEQQYSSLLKGGALQRLFGVMAPLSQTQSA